MADVRIICAPAALTMDSALETLRAAGEEDIASALTKVRAKWTRTIDKMLAQRMAVAIARAKVETERAENVVLVVELDGMRTFSEANLHEHHMKRHKRMGDIRPTVKLFVQQHAKERGVQPLLPCAVKLVRIAPSELDPSDNLPGALKPVQDGVADWLKVNDRSPLVRFTHGQEKRGELYGVRIEVSREVA